MRKGEGLCHESAQNEQQKIQVKSFKKLSALSCLMLEIAINGLRCLKKNR
jgi:hypothetical protein